MSRDQAKSKFFAIQAARWTGLVMVLIGLLAINQRIYLPQEAGYVLTIIGLIDALIVPTLLARRWRSPSP